MSSSSIAYNADDPLQAAFLYALGQGETGNSAFSSTEGVGGSNLAGSPTDAYGFPQWAGEGNSHAAGTYQFQPATWDAIASQYGLNFSNPSDQANGAWQLAQQTFSSATGGQSLETALQNGDYTAIQNALAGVWPSVTGNQAAPMGLGASLAAFLSGSGSGTSASGSAATPSASGGGAASGAGGASSGASSSGGLLSWFGSFFVRGGLIILGAGIIIVALWLLLSSQGYVPGPRQAAKAIASF